MRITIIGAGKVGRALGRRLRSTPHAVRVLSHRAGLPRTVIRDALVVLAVRDAALPGLAKQLAARPSVDRKTAVVHTAGAFSPDVLAPLRKVCAGVGVAHPMLSFGARARSLDGGRMLVMGDRTAVSRARSMARAMKLSALHVSQLDAALYHAAGAVVANGAVGLAAAGARMLIAAGIPEAEVPGLLGPLLASVGNNVTRLGLPEALTGPVRRGDVSTVERHLSAIHAATPELLSLYKASAKLQVGLAAKLREAPAADLRRLKRLLGPGRTPR